MNQRVIGYVRVSTDQQEISVAAQTARLRAYAMAMELDLVDVVVDAGYSAKSLDRPGLQSALARLASGDVGGLLVTKLDRLTRSVRDLGSLIESHFAEHALLSIGDAIDTRSAAGRLILNVLISVAQWEREAIGERTREALAHLKSQGVQLGAPMLDDEATLARIRSLRASGASLRAIAATMTAEGFKTQRGGAWGAETVRLIVNRLAA